MTNFVYLVTITDMDEQEQQLVFTDKKLALETLDKAVARMKTLHPELTSRQLEYEDSKCVFLVEEDDLYDDDIIMEMHTVPIMSEIYPQVSTDYCDEEKGYQMVDAWPTTDENDENGRTVAMIDIHDRIVTYKDEDGLQGENCVNVFNAIEDWILDNNLQNPEEYV